MAGNGGVATPVRSTGGRAEAGRLASVPAHHFADTPPPAADRANSVAELARAAARDDLAAVVAAVASMVGCTAALLRPDRSVVVVGEPSGSRRSGEGVERPHRWTASTIPAGCELVICGGSRRLGSLVFRRTVSEGELPATQRQTVHDILVLLLLARDAGRRASAADQRAALLACLAGEQTRRDHRPGTLAYRPVVVAEAGMKPEALATRLRTVIGRCPLPATAEVAVLDQRVSCLYPEVEGHAPRAHALAWQEVVRRAGPTCRAVIGMAGSAGAAVRESYATAVRLSDLQEVSTAGLCLPNVIVVDELGLVATALGPSWGGRQLAHFIQRVLADLLDNARFGGEVVDTLHAYLVSGGSPTEAAKLLNLSTSSMKYRMRVIRETLGDRLDDHNSVFEIELALRLLKAFEALQTVCPRRIEFDLTAQRRYLPAAAKL